MQYKNTDVTYVIREISYAVTELQKFCLEQQMKLVYVMAGLIGKISLLTMTEIYSKLESFLESSGINYVDTPKLMVCGRSGE